MREIRNPTYQRVRELLAREHRRALRGETGDLYHATVISASIENDEISSVEEGFMQGYLAA